ncbi:MAG: cyclase family protein [Chloroflexi bacterium]|nr:cyclase family protein [Chloroflexota bacterium]
MARQKRLNVAGDESSFLTACEEKPAGSDGETAPSSVLNTPVNRRSFLVSAMAGGAAAFVATSGGAAAASVSGGAGPAPEALARAMGGPLKSPLPLGADRPTEAQIFDWFNTLSNWGRWGTDELLGTLNLITPQKRAQAGALAREGTSISCALPIAYASEVDNLFPPRHFMLSSGERFTAPDHVGRVNPGDFFQFQPHGFTITHMDAPSHTMWRQTPGGPLTMFNGVPANRVTTQQGALSGSVDLAGGGIVSRGVLLDIPRLKGVDWLEPGTEIWPEDLEATEAAEGVRVEPGDILLFRTGHHKRRRTVGPQPGAAVHAGPQAACLPWVRERDIAVLGGDVANDVRPVEFPRTTGPFHGVGMAGLGLWLMDNAYLEDLALECQRLGRWEFLLVIAPLKFANATGCPVNPIALF